MESTLWFTLSLVAATTSMDCNCHEKYCFSITTAPSAINTTKDLSDVCWQMDNSSWPLEIYDKSIQDGVDKYLGSLDPSHSLRNIYLNVERTKGGWHYAMDRIYTSDLKEFQIVHHQDAVYLDVFKTKFETGWVKYFDLPYICSYNRSSRQCNATNSLDFTDQCFTAHKSPKTWIEAQNDCTSREGYLAVVKSHHMDRVWSWLDGRVTQWWVGIIWRPLKWLKRGTLVTWTNFPPSLEFMDMPGFVYFQINSDENKWQVSDNINTTNHVMCMKENTPDVCKGECFNDARSKDHTKMNIAIIVISVILTLIVTTVIIACLMKRRRSQHRTSQLYNNQRRSTNDPTNRKSMSINNKSISANQPIYFQPLPEIYEKHYDAIDEQQNNYEKLVM